ncbi:SDR family NAD(P)-dependent oxidoreductase [Nannocystaceae bacterium ST9]
MSGDLRVRYGPWALVAGASEGLGEAFANALAERGLNVIVIARRADKLEATAERLRAAHGVEVLALAIDLAAPDVDERIAAGVGAREVGLLIYNAAFSRVGSFLDTPIDDHLKTLAVNCRAPLLLVHRFGAAMRRRRRGGIVLMGSMSGLQGSPRLASYASSKAFARVFGESLWGELRSSGVDALTCIAGATRTPGFEAVAGDTPGPAMEPIDVAEQAIAALGRAPSMIPGLANKLAAWVLGKLPRRWQVLIMGAAMKAGAGSREDPG